MRLLSTIRGLLIVLLAGAPCTSRAQMIWRQPYGSSTIVLFKEVKRERYYCTWSIQFKDADRAGLVFQIDKPLVLWITWKTSETGGLSSGLYMQAVVGGINFPFVIDSVDAGNPMLSVQGEFGGALPQRTVDAFWNSLTTARSFRVYLPNGQFRDADVGGFASASQKLTQCLTEAETLNKATDGDAPTR